MAAPLVPSKLSIPETPAEVSEEWMCQAMTACLDGATSAKRTWTYEAKHQESGMLSSIFRAKFDVTFKDGSTQEHKAFIKVMPQDDLHKGFVTNMFLDVTEIESYKTLFPDLGEFEREQSGKQTEDNSIQSIIPHMYSADYCKDAAKRSFFLMLEDVSPEYEMQDFEKGLSLTQLLKSMRALAQFHATGYSYRKLKGDNIRKDYFNTFFDSFETDEGLAKFVEDNMDHVERDMKGSDVEDLIPLVGALRQDFGKKYNKLLQGQEGETKHFIMHGDIWANNVLFRQGGKCKIVDWQFTTAGNIFLDFGTMAWISMSAEDTSKNASAIIDVYFETFGETCLKLKCHAMPWKKEEFAKRARAEGFLLTFMWCSTSYELVHKYPALKERVQWVLREAIKWNPEAFSNSNF